MSLKSFSPSLTDGGSPLTFVNTQHKSKDTELKTNTFKQKRMSIKIIARAAIINEEFRCKSL